MATQELTRSSAGTIPVDARVRDFLSRTQRLLIGGRWQEAGSGRTFDTLDPATGERLGSVAEGDARDIDHAVQAARRAFDDGPWARMSPSDRGRILWRIGELIERDAEQLAQLETLDNGKPIAVARAADVPLAADLFRYMAGWATKIGGETITPSVPYMPGARWHAYTLREPVGVVGQIIPWNFPLLMAAWKLGPVLTCGNTVVLKPAEQTPLSALYLGQLMQEAGLPDGVINIVTGFGESAGGALAAHDDVDKVAFTGSTEVGRLIVRAAAGNLKKVTLELGGKSPNVVFGDADPQLAIAGAANAIFFNHGQCCAAGSRLYVQSDLFEEVVAGVADKARAIQIGPGMDPTSEMGPVVSQEQLDRVCGFLGSGQREGARVMSGGSRRSGPGYFVEPTVLVDATQDMQVVREEIFGPVVAAIPFDDPGQIPAVANETLYGLAAGIWTSDLNKAHLTAQRLRAGTVWVNCYNVFDAALPFGGYKQSGWGREMGGEVLEAYTEVKTVCIQLQDTPTEPPAGPPVARPDELASRNGHSATNGASPAAPTDIPLQEAAAFVGRLEDAWQRRDARAAAALYTDDAVQIYGTGQIRTGEELRRHPQQWFDFARDLRITKRLRGVNGDCVTVEWHAHYTHPETGEEMHERGAEFFYLRGALAYRQEMFEHSWRDGEGPGGRATA